MNRLKLPGILAIIIGFSLMTACSNQGYKRHGKHPLQIDTTFYPMYEFTKNITKNRAQVNLLIPANVEPHDWDPTPKDVASIQMSDLLIYNSSAMETWVPSIQNSLTDVTFVQASKGIALEKGTESENSRNSLDPHVWLDPVFAQKEVENITKAIVLKDPRNKGFYEKNSKDYIRKLKQLDQLYRETLKKTPEKDIVTQHAAFGYLAKEYGLNQVPIAGLTPEQEPSPAKLAELKKFVQAHHVKTIFFEEAASPKIAETLANETGAKAEVLSPLEGLSKEEQDKGLNYIEIMKRNLKALTNALSQ